MDYSLEVGWRSSFSQSIACSLKLRGVSKTFSHPAGFLRIVNDTPFFPRCLTRLHCYALHRTRLVPPTTLAPPTFCRDQTQVHRCRSQFLRPPLIHLHLHGAPKVICDGPHSKETSSRPFDRWFNSHSTRHNFRIGSKSFERICRPWVRRNRNLVRRGLSTKGEV
jgi:hypothetical protein